jgi:cation:H+ antiporter
MDLVTLLLFVVGLVLLVVGAEALVRSASRLAVAIGISPLVVGLTVVAFGTGSPELAVVVQSSLAGQPDVGLGNVIGSNIANVLLILGIGAVIVPLSVSQRLVRLEVPLMIGISFLVLLMALNGMITRMNGALLFAGMIAYTIFAIYGSCKENEEIQSEYNQEFGCEPPTGKQIFLQIALIAVGLALLVLGSRWLVGGAVAIATALGISELVIGLTVIAVGTSLPEIATSVIASLRGERDIAVGNVVGSNIFNILAVLGIMAILSPDGVPVASGVLGFDLPVMIAVAVACLPIFFTGCLIARWEGALFLAYYIAYTVYLILSAAEHDVLPTYSGVMLWFVIPITAVTLLVLVLRVWRTGQGRPAVD